MDQVRVDATWSAGVGFSMQDNLRGAYFQSRNLVLSLDVGDPHRIVRALGSEVCFSAGGGTKAEKRTRGLLAATRSLADRLSTPDAEAMASVAEGYLHYMLGEWHLAKKWLGRAEMLYRDQCLAVAFQLSSTRTMLYRTLGYLGALDELGERVPAVLRQVERQQDLYSMINLRTGPMMILGLAANDVERVRGDVAWSTERLAKTSFTVQHYFCLWPRRRSISTPATASRRTSGSLPAGPRSSVRCSFVQVLHVVALEQRARLAVAAALARPKGNTSEREALFREADRDQQRMDRYPAAWTKPMAALVRASVAAGRGTRDVAKRELEASNTSASIRWECVSTPRPRVAALVAFSEETKGRASYATPMFGWQVKGSPSLAASQHFSSPASTTSSSTRRAQ